MNFDEKYLKSLSSPNTDLTRFLGILNKRNTNLISFSNVDHKRLLSLFNRLNNNYLSRDYGDDLRVKLSLTDIFLKINSCAIEEEASTIISGFNENSLVTKAIEFIDKNYQNKLKQVSIALKKKTGNELRKVGVSSKGKKTLPSFENYDSTPIVSIRPMKISKVSNGGKDRHAFSKDYDNINYKYKSGCPLYESRK